MSGTTAPSHWATLGLERTRERAAIRRAYAARLRDTHPEDDRHGFEALRHAYEHALHFAEHGFDQLEGAFVFFEPDRDDDEPPADAIDAREAPLPRPAPRAETPAAVLGRQRLDAALANRSAAPDDLLAAFRAAVAEEALEDVGAFTTTEGWLAERIMSHAPRADVLIEPAIERFGWRDTGRRVGADPAVAAVVRRADALEWLASIKSPRHDSFQAWQAMQSQPSWNTPLRMMFDPQILGEIRALIPQIEVWRLEAMAGPVDAWRAYFSRPRLTPWAIYAMVFGGILSSLILVRATGDGTAGFFGGFGGAIALVVAKTYGLDTLRQRWRDEWSAGASPLARLGWAPIAITLPFVAAAPIGDAAPWVCGIAGLVLMAWSYLTFDLVEGDNLGLWLLRFGGRNGIFLLWWSAAYGVWASSSAAALTFSMLTSLAAISIGERSLATFWFLRVSQLARRVIRWAMVLIFGAGAVLALAADLDPQGRAWLGAALTASILSLRFTNASLGSISAAAPGLFQVMFMGAVFTRLATGMSSSGGAPSGSMLYVGAALFIALAAGANAMAALERD